MRLNEYKKVGKIADEVLTYFMKHGYKDLTLNLEVEDQQIIFNLTIKDIKPAEEKTVIDAFDSKRNYAVEGYGWELLGESESSSELTLVGMLFDRFYYSNEDGHGIVKLVRFI